MPIGRVALLRSLERQRRQLAASIVLTPVDSLPFSLADRGHTAFLHGLYVTDKVRDREASQAAAVQFGGRADAAKDIAGIHRLMADAFGAAEGSLRLLSGLHAHTATFMSISAAGDSVMLLSEEAGGHFSTHAILERLGLRTIDFPIDAARLCINQPAALELIRRERPTFIFVDRSEGLRYEDFSFIGAVEGPVKIFDASQYVPGILTKRYENPLAWGFDLMLFTLHKSFPGPQKAAVVSRSNGEVWDRLVAGLSTLVSSSHAENSYLFGLALLRADWLVEYARRLYETAVELEFQLLRRGISVFARDGQGKMDWPVTHHIWIVSASRAQAFRQFESLTETHVHTNYRKLPYSLGYGLRLGTTFSAVAGIDLPHVGEVAEIVASVIADGPTAALRERVRAVAEDALSGAILSEEHWAACR